MRLSLKPARAYLHRRQEALGDDCWLFSTLPLHQPLVQISSSIIHAEVTTGSMHGHLARVDALLRILCSCQSLLFCELSAILHYNSV